MYIAQCFIFHYISGSCKLFSSELWRCFVIRSAEGKSKPVDWRFGLLWHAATVWVVLETVSKARCFCLIVPFYCDILDGRSEPGLVYLSQGLAFTGKADRILLIAAQRTWHLSVKPFIYSPEVAKLPQLPLSPSCLFTLQGWWCQVVAGMLGVG